jgi:ribosome-binding factor A
MQQKNSNRVDRVNSLIQQLLGRVLLEFFHDGEAIVTVSRVICSKDLRWVKAFVTIANAKEDAPIMAKLRKHVYEIQGVLNQELQMKIVPRVSFHLDTSARYAAHINDIFKQIEAEEDDRGVANNEAKGLATAPTKKSKDGAKPGKK